MNPIFPFESLSDERRTIGLGVAVLIGIAPPGGQLPETWRPWMRAAIDRFFSDHVDC